MLVIVVLTQDLLSFSDLVLNRGLPASEVAGIALDRAIPALAWLLPFAVLIGCLVGLGRLAADGELHLLETAGISVLRLGTMTTAFALVAAIAGAWLSLAAAPAAQRNLDARIERIARQQPWSNLLPGRVHRFGEHKLTAREVSTSGHELRGVQLYIPSLGDTVFATSARLEPDGDGRARIVLRDAVSLPDPRDRPRALRADTVTTLLPRAEDALERDETDRLAGLPLAELGRIPADDARVEWHRRWSLPVAALLFGALSVPLFVRGARFSGAGGMLLGILGMVAYQALVQLGNGFVWSGALPPWAGTWLPNAVLAACVCLLPLGLQQRPSFGPRPERAGWRVRRAERRSRAAPGHRRALDRYVARSFVQTLLLCFAALLVIALVVDVLDRLDRFVRYAPTTLQVLSYYAARIPLLASRVMPLALLVATALTVTLLGGRGELVGMRACGVPAWRGLLPVLAICALLAPAYFVLTDRVIPRTNAIADRVNDLIKQRPAEAATLGVWFREGDAFFEGRVFDPDGGIAENLTVYELDERGLPTSRSDATRAMYVGQGMWRMEDHLRVVREPERVVRVESPRVTRLTTDLPSDVDTRHLSVADLRDEIATLVEAGVDATRFRVDLWVKLATPLGCLILPMIALFFALGGPPHPSTPATLVFSAAVAVAFLLLSGLGASLGYSGALPAPAAGFLPTLLLAGVALYLGRRLPILR